MAIKIEEYYEDCEKEILDTKNLIKKSKPNYIKRNKDSTSNFTTNTNFDRKVSEINAEKIISKTLKNKNIEEKRNEKNNVLESLLFQINNQIAPKSKFNNKIDDHYLKYSTINNSKSKSTKNKDQHISLKDKFNENSNLYVNTNFEAKTTKSYFKNENNFIINKKFANIYNNNFKFPLTNNKNSNKHYNGILNQYSNLNEDLFVENQKFISTKNEKNNSNLHSSLKNKELVKNLRNLNLKNLKFNETIENKENFLDSKIDFNIYSTRMDTNENYYSLNTEKTISNFELKLPINNELPNLNLKTQNSVYYNFTNKNNFKLFDSLYSLSSKSNINGYNLESDSNTNLYGSHSNINDNKKDKFYVNNEYQKVSFNDDLKLIKAKHHLFDSNFLRNKSMDFMANNLIYSTEDFEKSNIVKPFYNEKNKTDYVSIVKYYLDYCKNVIENKFKIKKSSKNTIKDNIDYLLDSVRNNSDNIQSYEYVNGLLDKAKKEFLLTLIKNDFEIKNVDMAINLINQTYRQVLYKTQNNEVIFSEMLLGEINSNILEYIHHVVNSDEKINELIDFNKYSMYFKQKKNDKTNKNSSGLFNDKLDFVENKRKRTSFLLANNFDLDTEKLVLKNISHLTGGNVMRNESLKKLNDKIDKIYKKTLINGEDINNNIKLLNFDNEFDENQKNYPFNNSKLKIDNDNNMTTLVTNKKVIFKRKNDNISEFNNEFNKEDLSNKINTKLNKQRLSINSNGNIENDIKEISDSENNTNDINTDNKQKSDEIDNKNNVKQSFKKHDQRNKKYKKRAEKVLDEENINDLEILVDNNVNKQKVNLVDTITIDDKTNKNKESFNTKVFASKKDNINLYQEYFDRLKTLENKLNNREFKDSNDYFEMHELNRSNFSDFKGLENKRLNEKRHVVKYENNNKSNNKNKSKELLSQISISNASKKHKKSFYSCDDELSFDNKNNSNLNPEINSVMNKGKLKLKNYKDKQRIRNIKILKNQESSFLKDEQNKLFEQIDRLKNNLKNSGLVDVTVSISDNSITKTNRSIIDLSASKNKNFNENKNVIISDNNHDNNATINNANENNKNTKNKQNSKTNSISNNIIDSKNHSSKDTNNKNSKLNDKLNDKFSFLNSLLNINKIDKNENKASINSKTNTNQKENENIHNNNKNLEKGIKTDQKNNDSGLKTGNKRVFNNADFSKLKSDMKQHLLKKANVVDKKESCSEKTTANLTKNNKIIDNKNHTINEDKNEINNTNNTNNSIIDQKNSVDNKEKSNNIDNADYLPVINKNSIIKERLASIKLTKNKIFDRNDKNKIEVDGSRNKDTDTNKSKELTKENKDKSKGNKNKTVDKNKKKVKIKEKNKEQKEYLKTEGELTDRAEKIKKTNSSHKLLMDTLFLKTNHELNNSSDESSSNDSINEDKSDNIEKDEINYKPKVVTITDDEK